MWALVIAFDEHVVDVHFYVLSDLVLENLVHQALVRSTSIFQTE